MDPTHKSHNALVPPILFVIFLRKWFSRQYLSECGVWRFDDVQVGRHDLCQIRDTLEPKTLEDKRDGLNHRVVMLWQWRVPDDTHQRRYGSSWVELLQGRLGAHVHQHFTQVGFWNKISWVSTLKFQRIMCTTKFVHISSTQRKWLPSYQCENSHYKDILTTNLL